MRFRIRRSEQVDVAMHLRIEVHREVGLQIVKRARPQAQPRGREFRLHPGAERALLQASPTSWRCSPRPWMPTRITLPGFRNTGSGLTPAPTPGGVPVLITSPATSVR